MLFERFEDKGLAHYSYAVGCPAEGKIAIVDPKRDIDTYIEFAEAQNLKISHILETHIHADYASGASELAQQTGAELWVSAYDKGEAFEVAFLHHDLQDGDSLTIGGVKIQALHTPGHTPEHLSFLVFDLNRSQETPMLMLTGDFLFVGSLGRPDLLGEEAKRALAERLYDSVTQKLAGLPDSLEIHPAHGAGSMCGAGMSGRSMTTLGFERIANPYLDSTLSKETFLEMILGTVPPFPDYYRRMKQVNSKGAKTLNGLPGLKAIESAEFKKQMDSSDHVIIDLRDQLSFGGGHIPGAFGIGAGENVSTWASWLVPYDRPILLVADDEGDIEPAIRSLIRVGLDDVVGFLKGGVQAWRSLGYPLQQLPQITPEQLHQRLQQNETLNVLDVREDGEWADGHIGQAVHVIGGELEKNLETLPDPKQPLVVVCGSGYRSTAAASVLLRHGYLHLMNMTGGMGAWNAAKLPTTTDDAAQQILQNT